MKVLMIGGSGQLARALREACTDLTALGRPVLDLADPIAVEARLREEDADVVINAAAYTNVDGAEDEAAVAHAINCEGVRALARGAAAAGSALLHISTDHVFDGRKKSAWVESDVTGPLNVYGASKLAGERAALSENARTLILRTSWLFAPWGRNFVTTMLSFGDREQISVVSDQFGTPTSALSLAHAIRQVLPALAAASADACFWGIRHYAGRGVTSRAEFACEIFSLAEGSLLERAPTVIPIPSSLYPTRARRPMMSALDCTAFEGDFAIEMMDWRQGLRGVIDRIKMEKPAL